jgi:hypothetical protein
MKHGSGMEFNRDESDGYGFRTEAGLILPLGYGELQSGHLCR